jgi:hypothetical protein
MPEKLEPPASLPAIIATADEDAESLRRLSRSPHPYHRQKSELLEPSGILVYRAAASGGQRSVDAAGYTKESTPASDSGTEADDEHFLKRLPAPKASLHKGLRGQNEASSGTSTPLLSPAVLEEEGRRTLTGASRDRLENRRSKGENVRRRKEFVRRSAEVFLLLCLGGLVQANQDVQPFTKIWRNGMSRTLIFSLV